MRSAQNLLFSWLNKPNALTSFFTGEKNDHHSDHFVVLIWT